MYLYTSLCIFMYLFVSDISLRIFMYLSKPFRKIRTYLYVSLCIFSTGFERYIKIPKDTLRYIKMHGWWNMSYYWIEKSRLAACDTLSCGKSFPQCFAPPKWNNKCKQKLRIRSSEQREDIDFSRAISKIWQKKQRKRV